MGNLKIGFVLDDTLDTPDGVQQYILTLGTWMSAQGHDVHYLVGHTERTDIQNVHSLGRNVKVQFNGNRMSTPLPASKRKLRTLLESEKYDVLHIQIPYSPFLAQRIIMAAPAATALIGTFHIAPNSRVVTAANKLLGMMTKRSLKRFDTLLSVSPAAKQFAQITYGIETSVLPNVVKAAHFRLAEPFNKYSGKPTIVFLGRLVQRKGCQTLLEAVELLKRQKNLPDFRVIICGRGPLDGELKKYAKAQGLENIVEFVGFVNDDEKARYLKSADIAVFPSSGGESFGIVLLEAMAAEHPVVLGADNPGYASVLAPYPDLLFPVLNNAALAAKLQVYLTDTSARNRAVSWQHTYLPQFDVAAVGSRLIARYREALRSRRTP
jgi:phosphatidylinositol alpha-mannosyltransferase